MRNKLVEVAPFPFTYRVFNKTDGEYHGEFTRLFEAVRFIAHRFKPQAYNQPSVSFTLKTEPVFRYTTGYVWDSGNDWSRRRYTYAYAAPTPWVIVSEGGVVGEAEVAAAKRYLRNPWANYGWEERQRRWNIRGRRLTRKKGSGHKIKAACERVPSVWRMGDFDNRIRGYYRAIKTFQEHRANEAHAKEYGPGLVRARRGKKYLPTAWDDRYSSINRAEDNWKHHSKRRKQWKPK